MNAVTSSKVISFTRLLSRFSVTYAIKVPADEWRRFYSRNTIKSVDFENVLIWKNKTNVAKFDYIVTYVLEIFIRMNI